MSDHPAVGDWVRLVAVRGPFSTDHPEHQPRLHRVVSVDRDGRVLTACYRSTFQGDDPWQTPDGIDVRPRCHNCEHRHLAVRVQPRGHID